MIVDCYTHVWDSEARLGAYDPQSARPRLPNASDPLAAGIARHLAACEPVSAAIVVGFKSRHLGLEIPNSFIASYVSDHRDKLIGFAGIDPSNPREAIAELRTARRDLRMPGVAVAPPAQDFHPSNSQAMLVYAEAAERRMPILFHCGLGICAETKLEYARPVLLDEVARELPELKIIIAHLGLLWTREAIFLLAKHPNVYAEISWLLHDPWQAYQALIAAHEHGVMHKLLFGSGFPCCSPAQYIELLHTIPQLSQGTNLPTIPREELRAIIERDALTLLGLSKPGGEAAPATTTGPIPDEEPEDL